jgi:glycosyltransferase involved in cell wall biosynthesis
MMAIGAERWCFRRSRTRGVIAVSAGVANEIARYFPALADRVHVIPHGVDSRRFRADSTARSTIRAECGLTPDDLVAVFVGGDWKRKGLTHAIEAMARADGWKLLVVGPGHCAPYAHRARELGAADRVCFVGVTDLVPAHLAAGDVFILPTEYETFCLVAFEAAAVGLPILATAVSGPDILIEPGVNGEFLDGDAGRTGQLLDGYADPVRRLAHGDAARTKAGSFTWDKAIASHMTLYERLTPPGQALPSSGARPRSGAQGP